MEKKEMLNFYQIPNLEGYRINKNGDVYSEKSEKCIKPNNGTIELYIDGHKKRMSIAHLVLETFVGNPQNARRIRYINGNKNDVSLGNVEWVVPVVSNKRTPQINATAIRKKEIALKIKNLQKQMKVLEREEQSLRQLNNASHNIKNNLFNIVEGIARGENITKLTKRVLGRKMTKDWLSKHLIKLCGLSLDDIVCIANLYKAKPNIVEAIIHLQKNNKIKNVIFNINNN